MTNNFPIMIKRVALLLTALALLFSLALPVHGEGGISLSLDRVEGKVGEEVSLTLTAQDNPGIVSIQLQLDYDETKLRLVSVSDGGILGDEIHHQENLVRPYTLSWENYTAEQNFTEDGVLCTLRFRIVDGEEGEEIPVTLSAGEYGVMNYNLADLPCTLTNGSVTVTGSVSGGFWLPWLAAGICVAAAIGAALVFQNRSKKKSPAKEK